MIKVNELPNIFEKSDKKKKKKKVKHNDDYLLHVETKNTSFLKMYRILEMLGVDNNDYFLALYDERLVDINPYDEDLTTEEQLLVLKECQKNFWYFIREIVRIPVDGSDIGSGKQYQLHRGNLALNWCFLNSVNFFLELPRQNFKSVSIDVILLWVYNFHSSNTSMLIMNKEHKDAKDNLETILKMRNILPKYLRFNTRFNEEGKELKLIENKQFVTNPKNGNTLITKPCATSKTKADNLGRGMRQSIQWFDEFGFLKYNMIIYEAAAPAASQASEEAELNGKAHCQMISTTPGDMETDYGKDAYTFKNKCVMFREEFYDWNVEDVKEMIRLNSGNGYVNIIFSYKQLGRSSEYFAKMRLQLGDNWFKIRREVLLQWISYDEDSPFNPKDIDRLRDMTYTEDDVVKTIFIDKYYPIKLYEPIDPTTTMILASDVASGAARDNSSIAIINTKTKRCIGEFENNKVDTLTFSKILYTLSTDAIPNSLICVERNNVGASVLSNLAKTSAKSKLYYETNTNSDIEDRIRNGRAVKQGDNRKYGFWTDEPKREVMMEILQKIVSTYKDRIRTPLLSREISALKYIKGRIDHPADGHDDMVMGYLIGMWIYYYGKNLGRYGIIRMPDVDPSTGMTEEEQLLALEKEQERKNQEMNMVLNRINAAVDDDSGTLPIKEFKTINDYYKEIDKAKEAQYAKMDANVKVNFEDAINDKPHSNGVINLSTHNGNPFSIDNNSNSFGQGIVDDITGGDF